MRLKTPKRYQSKYQRSSWFSLRWAWFWLFAIIAASTLFYIYQNRSVFLPAANNLMATAMGSVGEGLSTVIAPTPTATADPSGAILQADAAWDRGAIEDAQILYTSVIEQCAGTLSLYVVVVDERPTPRSGHRGGELGDSRPVRQQRLGLARDGVGLEWALHRCDVQRPTRD
jgi:hypothetical protein